MPLYPTQSDVNCTQIMIVILICALVRPLERAPEWLVIISSSWAINDVKSDDIYHKSKCDVNVNGAPKVANGSIECKGGY